MEIYQSPLYVGYSSELYHYGVPGMKWGVRKARELVGRHVSRLDDAAIRVASRAMQGSSARRMARIRARETAAYLRNRARRRLNTSARSAALAGYKALGDWDSGPAQQARSMVKKALGRQSEKFKAASLKSLRNMTVKQQGQYDYIQKMIAGYSHVVAGRTGHASTQQMLDRTRAMSRYTQNTLNRIGSMASEASKARAMYRNATGGSLSGQMLLRDFNKYGAKATQMMSEYVPTQKLGKLLVTNAPGAKQLVVSSANDIRKLFS